MLKYLTKHKYLCFFLALWILLSAGRSLALDVNETINILQAGAQSQQAISQSFDQMWEDILNSALYDTIATLGALAAVLLILYNYIDFYEKLQQSGGSWTVLLKRVIWLVVVFSLLINQAALFRTFTFTLRNVWNGINSAVLTEPLIVNQQLLNAYNEVTGGITLQQYYSQRLTQCQAIPEADRREQCIQTAQESVNTIAQQQNYSPNFAERVINGLGAAVANAIEQQMVILMLSLAIAVQWLVEISWILTALVGPLFLGLSMLPVSQKGLWGWLIAFCSIGFYKLCFNILVGLVAYLNGQTPSLNGLLFSVAVGILCPILAFVLAAGGGMGIFTSLASAASAVAAPVAGAAGSMALRGGMGAARGGGRIVGHAIGRSPVGQAVGSRFSQAASKLGNSHAGRILRTIYQDSQTPLRK